MKRILFVIAVLLGASLPSAYCIVVSVNKTTNTAFSMQKPIKEIIVKPFTSLQVSSAVKVRLVRSTENRVEVIEDKKDQLFVAQKGNVLRIDREDDRDVNVLRISEKTETIFIVLYYTEDISFFKVSSASSVISDDVFKASKVECVVSSAADVSLNIETDTAIVLASSSGDVSLDVKSKIIDVEASSASSVFLKGVASDVRLSVSSSAEVDAKDMEINVVSVVASSASKCKLYATNSVNVNASSASKVNIYGTPTDVNASASSGGKVVVYGEQPNVFVSQSSSGGKVTVKK